MQHDLVPAAVVPGFVAVLEPVVGPVIRSWETIPCWDDIMNTVCVLYK